MRNAFALVFAERTERGVLAARLEADPWCTARMGEFPGVDVVVVAAVVELPRLLFDNAAFDLDLPADDDRADEPGE